MNRLLVSLFLLIAIAVTLPACGGQTTPTIPGGLSDGNQNAYAAGEFQQTVDFDPGTGTDSHSSVDDEDAFLVKVLPNGLWN